jgi:hypothetical protein
VSQSSEFCRHNPLCCFSTSNTKGKRIFRYRLSPETFGYTLVPLNFMRNIFLCVCLKITNTATALNLRLCNQFSVLEIYAMKFCPTFLSFIINYESHSPFRMHRNGIILSQNVSRSVRLHFHSSIVSYFGLQIIWNDSPTLRPTHPHVQWVSEVRQPVCEADHSPPSSVEVRNAWRYISTPPYVFLAWYLVKPRDSFTFTLYEGVSKSFRTESIAK